MEKLKMKSINTVNKKLCLLKELFPNAITEIINDEGELEIALDNEILTQELNIKIISNHEDRYQFTWPEKRKSLLLANKPISETLRPCIEDSLGKDGTPGIFNSENIYIEGDNLDVLKLLQQTYINKIKMIYIDPPYNTGSDFVYDDDFFETTKEYLDKSGQFDKDGNKLVQNTESNGRFHTDWLNMIYPRLKLAKNLLREDGIIFISIDDNEHANLKKICDEIFGENNFIANLPTIMNLKGNNDEFGFAGTHEYTLVYMKNKLSVDDLNGLQLSKEDKLEYKLKDDKGFYKQGATLMRTGEAGAREKRPKGYYPIYVSQDLSRISINRMDTSDYEVFPKTADGKEMSWRRSPDFLMETRDEFIIKNNNGSISFYKKQRLDDDLKKGKKAKSLFYKPEYSSGNGTKVIKDLFQGRFFDNPKPVELLKDFIKIGSNDDDIILDFFSGSATTAHAVMQLNVQDGGNRKYIMVQLPEICDEKTPAAKAGFKNICEIGKERIRRASKLIQEESSIISKNKDLGFRVFKLDSTNMKDVFYNPSELLQIDLDGTINNIKDDRTDMDLLIQVMLDLAIPLSSSIKTIDVSNKKVFSIEDNYLLACFESNITNDIVTEIAKLNPRYFIMRDISLGSDSVASNFDQIFKTYSPDTIRKVL